MLEEIQKPLGDFIINNAEGVQGSDGVYYHYSEVCKLLRLYKKEILSGETVKLRERCNCMRSGSCTYECIMHSKQQECRHKITP